jgi:hypothetical protein
MRKVFALGAVVALLMMAVPSFGAVLEVDHFKDGFFSLSVDQGSPAADSGTIGGLSVLGGTRHAILTWTSGTGTNLDVEASVALQANPATEHWLDFSADTGLQGSLQLIYGESGGLGDLTNGGTSNNVAIKFLASDLGANVLLTLEDGSSASHTENLVTGSGPNFLVFPFTPFVNAGVDPTNIDTLMFQIDGVPSGDYRIDAIESGFIPEPITLVGMSLALGGLARYTRKRRKA